MNAVVQISPEERLPFAFILAIEIGHLQHGTREHRDVAAGLRDVYSSLYDAPDGPIEIELSPDELYMLGIRIYADVSELEEWWLDHRASLRAIQEAALFPDENFGSAVRRFFPEALDRPQEWNFEQVRPLFGSLARKFDLAMITYAPTARALYNKERTEINNRTRRMQADRAAARSQRYPGIATGPVWRPTARVGDLGTGEMAVFEPEGRRILVANVGDAFYAIDAICTHVPTLSALSDLSNGSLDLATKCVTCPWHGSQFDLTTGRVVVQPYPAGFNREHLLRSGLPAVLDPKRTATDTRVYPTKIEDGRVWVDIA